MNLKNPFSPTVSVTSQPLGGGNLTTTNIPTTTFTPTTTTSTLGQDYGQLLGQWQAYQQAAQANYPTSPPTSYATKLPSRDHVQKRIAETEKLLDLLKEVDRILEVHPDLERLIGTLGRLGEL